MKAVVLSRVIYPIVVFVFLSLGQQSMAQERVAVFDFEITTGLTESDAIVLTNKFRNEIANAPNYTSVERDKIEAVVKEGLFGESDIADQNEAIQLGRQLSATKIILGNIGKIGTTYSVVVRIIDVETGSIENSESLEHRGQLEDLLVELEVMAKKLTGTYVKKKKRGWLYVTGVVIVGSVVTGLLLFSDDGGDATLPVPPSPPSN
tara:strand:- start:55095 stop:55712 length:618 start_codon:yes stop_codon:yes gene_type:complete